MPSERPPSIDPVAAARWAAHPLTGSPWLHEEVARRMVERLRWIRQQPRSWVDWEPLSGGLEAHRTLAQRWPQAHNVVHEPDAARGARTQAALRKAWWSPARWSAAAPRLAAPEPGAADMVWANMALHMHADPQALMAQWLRALQPQGYLMFSALGPDTLRELRAVYQALGWPPPSHDFTDMHDWGDMLVHGGFAEPVLDVERIVLTFASVPRALLELRQLGRNLHPGRPPSLRGRGWLSALESAWRTQRPADAPDFALTFEVIYGHALKAPPRLAVQAETTVSLDVMRQRLRQGREGPVKPG